MMNLQNTLKKRFDARYALYFIDVVQYLGVDLQVQLSHAWDYGFLALWVEMYPESGVLSGEAVNAFGELVRVILKGPEDMLDRLCAARFSLMSASVAYA